MAGPQFQDKADAQITPVVHLHLMNSLLYSPPPCCSHTRVQGTGSSAQGPRGQFCVHPLCPVPLQHLPGASARCALASASEGHRLQKSCWKLAERNGGFQFNSFSFKGNGRVSSTVCFHGSQPSSLRWSFCRSWKFPRGYAGMLDITFSHFYLQF